MIFNLLFTSIILTNLVNITSIICSFFVHYLSSCFSYYVFDTISDPINSKNLLKKIKENGGFISKYNIDDGKQPEGLF